MEDQKEKLANTILEHSISLQEEDTVLIRVELPFLSFAQELADKIKAKGAQVLMDIYDLDAQRTLLQTPDVWEAERQRLCSMADRCTACIRISAESDPLYLSGIPPETISSYKEKVARHFIDKVIKKKWNLAAFPSEAEARHAGMTEQEYSDFLFSATNIDWKKTEEQMQKIKEIFDKGEEVRIVIPGQTDLTFSLKGRGGEICAGKHNLPDGEIMYGPEENSANGYITFQHPTLLDGNEVSGIRLQFKDGEVINYEARYNHEFLDAMMKVQGATRIGEFGIGCNYGIKKPTKNILFDEKIGGTIHLALGSSYEQPLERGGGKNKSKIHWDMICDLRKEGQLPGGKIFVDGKLVQENGEWVELNKIGETQ